MGFKETVTRIEDGTPVDAATTNPCLDDLQNNILYVKSLVDVLSGGEVLVKKAVAFASDVTAPHACYWNYGNLRYELAIADGGPRGEVAGLCLEKSGPTAGDLLVLGWKTLDITPALQSGETLAGARYYLSKTQPGKLTQTKPNEHAVPVLIADGQEHIIVVPQTGNRGHQGYRGYQGFQGRGYQGARGYQGFQGKRGYQGILTNASALGSATGATTDGFVLAYDSGINASGLLFAGTIKNTAGNPLTYRLTATDAFGITDNLDTNVAAGLYSIFHAQGAVGTSVPPFTRIQVLVKSQSPGLATTFNLKLTRTVG